MIVSVPMFFAKNIGTETIMLHDSLTSYAVADDAHERSWKARIMKSTPKMML
jgi:hypothetical protein